MTEIDNLRMHDVAYVLQAYKITHMPSHKDHVANLSIPSER